MNSSFKTSSTAFKCHRRVSRSGLYLPQASRRVIAGRIGARKLLERKKTHRAKIKHVSDLESFMYYTYQLVLNSMVLSCPRKGTYSKFAANVSGPIGVLFSIIPLYSYNWKLFFSDLGPKEYPTPKTANPTAREKLNLSSVMASVFLITSSSFFL